MDAGAQVVIVFSRAFSPVTDTESGSTLFVSSFVSLNNEVMMQRTLENGWLRKGSANEGLRFIHLRRLT